MIIIIFPIKLQTCSILWFPLFWTIPLKYVKETWFPANVPLNSAFFSRFSSSINAPISHAQDRGPCLDAGAAVGEVGSWTNLSHGTEIGGVLDQQRSAPWLWGVGPGPSGHLPGRHFVKLHRERQRNGWKRGQLIPGTSFVHVVFFFFVGVVSWIELCIEYIDCLFDYILFCNCRSRIARGDHSACVLGLGIALGFGRTLALRFATSHKCARQLFDG